MVRAGGLILVHYALFAAAAAVIVRFVQPPLLGVVIGGWGILFVTLLGVLCWMRSDGELLDLWTFLLPLSAFQLLPDVILVQLFGVLVFPDLGGARWLGVPLYMAGLWMAPLLLVVWIASLVNRRSAGLALVVAALAALALFGAAEWAARPLALWHARGVGMVQGVAVYVLPAEMLLGVATWVAYSAVQGRNWLSQILAAGAVSLFYTGALAASYFVVERMPA